MPVIPDILFLYIHPLVLGINAGLPLWIVQTDNVMESGIVDMSRELILRTVLDPRHHILLDGSEIIIRCNYREAINPLQNQCWSKDGWMNGCISTNLEVVPTDSQVDRVRGLRVRV